MKNWLSACAVNFERRPIVVFLLGFSSGLPFPLVFGTLTTWLARDGVSKTMIGVFALVGSAYGLKYLWSPLVDRLPLPPFTTLLGRRRGWLIFSQLALVVTILGLGSMDPSEQLWWTAVWAVAVAFASATQDIAIDAYRIEVLEERQLGAGAANVVLGWRVGALAGGAGALWIAGDAQNWFLAYVTMAALMGVGIVTVLLMSEPEIRLTPEAQAREGRLAQFRERFLHLPGSLQTAAAWIQSAVINPFAEFLMRNRWNAVAILLFAALYRYSDGLLGVMANPFYVEMGFTNNEIAAISKVWGLWMTIIGSLVGGIMVARFGMLPALLICGVAQAVSNLMYIPQVWVGHDTTMLTAVIAIENLTGGMATAAFVAYLSSLCNISYTATQYAMLTSLMATTRPFLSFGAGGLAETVGWENFFLITTLAGLPGMLLLLWMMRRFPRATSAMPTRPALDGND